MEKLIFVATISKRLASCIGLPNKAIKVYRSKGLLAHLISRRHFVAVKYFDFLPKIIESPDYAGIFNGQIELVKCFKDTIFLSVKFDTIRGKHYIATVFDARQSKIATYCKKGWLQKITIL